MNIIINFTLVFILLFVFHLPCYKKFNSIFSWTTGWFPFDLILHTEGFGRHDTQSIFISVTYIIWHLCLCHLIVYCIILTPMFCVTSLPRVCGKVNIFCRVCVCLSVCLCVSVCSGYNFWMSWHKKLHFLPPTYAIQVLFFMVPWVPVCVCVSVCWLVCVFSFGYNFFNQLT